MQIVPEMPAQAIVEYVFPNANNDSYGTIYVQHPDGTWEPYDGWCVNLEGKYKQNVEHQANIIPFDDPAAQALVSNLDLVNFIVNHKEVYFGWGYDIWDIQATIWFLVGDDMDPVDEILEHAEAGVGSFEPGCDGVVTHVVQPTSEYEDGKVAQITIIEVPIECIPLCETAWAFNKCDPYIKRGNWARYFTHTVTIESSGTDDCSCWWWWWSHWNKRNRWRWKWWWCCK
jgi:hypothetical protein